MLIMLIVLALLVLGVAITAMAIAYGERNHRLIAREEGLDRDLADFTDIDFTDEGTLSPIPERTAEESAKVVEGLLEALANGPGEPILTVDEELVRCPPEWDCGRFCIQEDADAAQEQWLNTEKEAPGDGVAKEGIEVALGEQVEFATGGIVDVSKMTLIGPGDDTRESPEDLEVVIPPVQPDIITRVQKEMAAQAPTEWKRWNKP